MTTQRLNLVFLAAAICACNGAGETSVINKKDGIIPVIMQEQLGTYHSHQAISNPADNPFATETLCEVGDECADVEQGPVYTVMDSTDHEHELSPATDLELSFISEHHCHDGDCDEQDEPADGDHDDCDDASEQGDLDDQPHDQMAEPVCGNGILEPGESCDDGNENDGDWCSNECVSSTDADLPSTVLIDESFAFGLGSFNHCRPSCSGDRCPTVTGGAVQLKEASTSVCLPSIQVAARGKLVEHAFTMDADGLDLVVMRDWPLNKWRIAINFDEGIVEYQSPSNGQRVGFSVDLSNARSERQWRVIFDSNLNQAFIVAGESYLGAVPFPAERVDDMMWTSYTSAHGGAAPTLSHYTVTRFDTAE